MPAGSAGSSLILLVLFRGSNDPRKTILESITTLHTKWMTQHDKINDFTSGPWPSKLGPATGGLGCFEASWFQQAAQKKQKHLSKSELCEQSIREK
jgi:hypothetical protein